MRTLSSSAHPYTHKNNSLDDDEEGKQTGQSLRQNNSYGRMYIVKGMHIVLAAFNIMCIIIKHYAIKLHHNLYKAPAAAGPTK